MTKRAARYIRQSKTDDDGVDRQDERTAALVTARGWVDVGTYVDNEVSASKARGAGTAWARMLADADAGLIDVVVAVDLDRLLRTTRDLNVLIDHGLAAVTLDGEIDLATADGEFRASMLASIARFEVRRKGERQSRANVTRATNGGVPKGVRLTGYTTDGELVESEAERIRGWFAGFLAGETLRTMARNSGVNPTSIRTALTNPRYAGRRVYKGEVVGAGKWVPIVSGDEFDVVNRRLADPRRVTNRTGSTARSALGTSLFRCGDCGETQTVRTAGGGGRRYMCPRCKMSRTMDRVDDLVLRTLHARLIQADSLDTLTPRLDGTALHVEAEALRERRAGIASLIGDGLMSAIDARPQLEKLREQIDAVERKLDAATTPAIRLTPEELNDNLAGLSLDRRRALIASLLTVTLLRQPVGRRGFDPQSVLIDWV
jgi:site-specific DNA recombinase